MVDLSRIGENAHVIGADGVHIGTVHSVVKGPGDHYRIALKVADSAADVIEGRGAHVGHRHYIPTGLIADIESGTVRLSANAAVAVTFEEEE
jgi:hypothetical protein